MMKGVVIQPPRPRAAAVGGGGASLSLEREVLFPPPCKDVIFVRK